MTSRKASASVPPPAVEEPIPVPPSIDQKAAQAAAQAMQAARLREAHGLALTIQEATFIAATNQMMELLGSWFTTVQGFSRDNFDGDCMLITTELAEAVEGDRKGALDEHCPGMKNRDVEMADALIRLLHTCHKYGVPVGPALMAKMRYNFTRPVRHGKGY
jgi:hypothetical protein